MADTTEQAGWTELSGLEALRGAISGRFQLAPLAAALGITALEVDEGRVVLGMTPSELHLSEVGAIHGGMLSTLLDSALGFAVFSALPTASWRCPTVALDIKFVRAAPIDASLRCEASLVHRGRSMATSIGEIRVDGDDGLVAHGSAVSRLLAPPG